MTLSLAEHAKASAKASAAISSPAAAGAASIRRSPTRARSASKDWTPENGMGERPGMAGAETMEKVKNKKRTTARGVVFPRGHPS